MTQYSVPNAPAGTGFDQFPGAPAVTGGSTVVFKGNYTVNGAAETGVFFRNTSLGPTAPTEAIAQSGQPIPGFPGAVFGSTAPPSAAAGKVVFTGLDSESAPTAGGIYLAPLTPNPKLTTLAKIGEAVPKTGGQTFSTFGEGLSFNGGNVGFWASWGTATMTVHVACASEGMAAAYCLSKYPNGADLTEPLHQGIFDLNTTTDALTMIAQTGVNGYTDFLNWTFSGRVPGSENENDGEPARWRSSAYLSDSSGNVVFLGQKGSLDGLYLGAGNSIDTLLTTDSLGQSVDPMAPAGSLVSSIGLERDGFVGDRLGVSVGMLDPATAESWGGIYLTPRVPETVLAALRLSTPVPEPSTWALLLSGFAGLGYLAWRRGGKRQAAAN